MYGQMTAGSGSTSARRGSCRAPTRRSPRSRSKRFGGTLRGTIVAHRGARRHGRRAAAGRHDERRRRAVRRGRPDARSSAGSSTRYLDVGADDVEEALRWRVEARDRRDGRCRSASSATRPTSCPSCSHAARRSTSSPTRPARTTRSRYVPRGLSLDEAADLRVADAADYIVARARLDGGALPRDGRRSSTRAPRSSTTATACAARPSTAGSTARSPIRASCPPTSGRCSARARGRSGGRRCPATRPTSRRPIGAVLDAFPDNEPLARWIRMARRAGRLPGPARADLLAGLRRARNGWACGSTSWSPAARCRRRS